MTEKRIIDCPPSKWFKIRAVLVLIMLLFFALWFLKDGVWGYRQKNLEYVTHHLFENPREGQPSYIVNAHEVFKNGNFTKESWAEYARKQVVPTPDKSRGLLPRDYDYNTKWPEELVNGYDALKKGQQLKLWNAFSGRMKWSQEVEHKLLDEGKIREQYITAAICGVLILIALFYIIRIFRRRMYVTEDAYYAPGGVKVPFSSMRKIDKRKWDTKGIALITYEEDGKMKKAKVDGMLYGHFAEEDGAPAEKLMDFIMKNFKGEVVEYVDVDDDKEASEGEVEGKEIDDNSKTGNS